MTLLLIDSVHVIDKIRHLEVGYDFASSEDKGIITVQLEVLNSILEHSFKLNFPAQYNGVELSEEMVKKRKSVTE